MTLSSARPQDQLLASIRDITRDHQGDPSEALSGISTSELEAALDAVGVAMRGLGVDAGPGQADALVQPLFEARATRDQGGLAYTSSWLESYGNLLTAQETYKLANRIAWITRGSDTELPHRVTHLGERYWLYIALLRKRFVFDDESMSRILRAVDVAAEQRDSVIQSLEAFCTIRRTRDSVQARAAIDFALSRDDMRDLGEVVFDTLAHAVWLNFRLEQQGEILQDVCERATAYSGRSSAVILFRHATALRLQGHYEEGVDKVEEALATLQGGTEFIRTFSEQCLRERELCVAGMAMRRDAQAMQGHLVEIKQELNELERKSTTRTIEIITLFTAVVAFAIGGGSIATNAANGPRESLLVLGGFGSVLVTFALVVVVVVDISLRDRTPKRRLLGLVVTVASVIVAQFVMLAAVATLLD